MAALPTAVKLHILTALACFDTPSEVAASVKVNFGLELSRQCIEAHHPHRRAGARLAPKWREIFDGTRARLYAELESIPLAHQSVRLRALGRIAQQAEQVRNFVLAARIFEQAAKEVGGIYVGRRSGATAPVTGRAHTG